MRSGPKDPVVMLKLAVRACAQGNWRAGLTLLTHLGQRLERHGKLPGFYYSYLGQAIARCEGRKREGVQLCRHAVVLQPLQPENHLNLARSYLMVRNRRAALRALERGLSIDPTHHGLLEFAGELGVRRRPPLPFLPRANALNRLFGGLIGRAETRLAERRGRLLDAEEEGDYPSWGNWRRPSQ